MKNCTEFVELMQRQMDGELSELELKRLEKHIHHCPACAADYLTFQEMNELFQDVHMVEPPMELQSLIMAEIMSESEPVPEAATPIGGIIAMVLAATINGFLFLFRVLPFFNVQFNSTERRMITQLFIQFFARFAIVGRHTGEALQKAFQTVALYLPWQLVITYLIVTVGTVLGLIYFIHQGRKGGNLT